MWSQIKKLSVWEWALILMFSVTATYFMMPRLDPPLKYIPRCKEHNVTDSQCIEALYLAHEVIDQTRKLVQN